MEGKGMAGPGDQRRAARVGEMELSRRDISGPVQWAAQALLSGWRANGRQGHPPEA